MNCARCEWRHDPNDELRPREQLEQHAETAGHPLCVVCHRSLMRDEQQTCENPRPGRHPHDPPLESCLTRARSMLSGIVNMYFLDAPTNLGQLRGKALDTQRRGGGDGRPLPGGDLLVLIGNGSEGLSDDGLTVKDDDPSSVAFDFAFWEDAWRRARNEPHERSTHRPRVIVRQAARYLEIHMRWASRQHPAFADLLEDLHQLHERLERANGRHLRPMRAEAECFRCGANALERDVDEHGYADVWVCQRCGDTYDWQRYLLALGQRLRQEDVPGWGLPEQVGHVLGVNPKTVRGWAARGQVSTACLREGDPRVRVWWDDARERAEKLEEQRRRQAERQAEKQAS